jgi:hypothetical protein
MHGRADCDDCFMDIANGCWEGRTGAGRPVRVRMIGGWVDVITRENTFALNPIFARRMAVALIQEAERAERETAAREGQRV